MTSLDATNFVAAWQVAECSNIEWSNIAGTESYEDNYLNHWQLSDSPCGDYIGLYINCHPMVLLSNIVIDPTEDYSRLLAHIVDSIVPHDYQERFNDDGGVGTEAEGSRL